MITGGPRAAGLLLALGRASLFALGGAVRSRSLIWPSPPWGDPGSFALGDLVLAARRFSATAESRAWSTGSRILVGHLAELGGIGPSICAVRSIRRLFFAELLGIAGPEASVFLDLLGRPFWALAPSSRSRLLEQRRCGAFIQIPVAAFCAGRIGLRCSHRLFPLQAVPARHKEDDNPSDSHNLAIVRQPTAQRRVGFWS